MNFKIINFIVVLILLSTFTFAYETVFDWTITWDEKTHISSFIGEGVGSKVEHDFNNLPYIVDWIYFDMSNSPGQCGNSFRLIFKDQNHNKIESKDFSSSRTLYVGNQTGNYIVVEKIGGNTHFEVPKGCGNFLSNYYSCVGRSLGLSKSKKKKKVSCGFNYAIGVKFMNPINNSDTSSINNDCPKGATGSGNDDCPRDLGKISGLISPPKPTAVKILSTNDNVIAWFDPAGSLSFDKRTSKTITSDFDFHAYACVDSDKNDECDFDQIQRCADQKGDWYNDNCCMDPGKPVPQGQTKRVPEFYQGIGICGKNSKGEYKWAPLEAGVFAELDQDPGVRVVSDGKKYFDCGGKKTNLPSSIASLISNLDLLTVKRTIIATPRQINQPRTYDRSHSIICLNNNAYECKGEDSIYLSKKSLNLFQSKTGESLVDSKGKTVYCTDDGFWDSELDNPIRVKACDNAGFKHTGTKCCGEPEDKPEYFNDVNGLGACWNSIPVLNGDFAPNLKSIIAYKGVLNGCNVKDPALLSLVDKHNQQKLITELTDGSFLVNANKVYSATCQPYGNFTLTKSSLTPSRTRASWDVTKEGLAMIHQEGYCDTTECWNGIDCQGTKTFYLGKDKSFGFVCV